MQLLRSLESIPEPVRHGALSIGNFDGVHRGHVRLAERMVATARELGGPAVVFTFDPHPAQLLRPEAAPKPLSWTERNAALLGDLGVDAVIVFPTDLAFLELDAAEFFDRIVRERLDARAMVEGPDFFFGHDRSGNVESLQCLCGQAGIRVEVVEPVAAAGQWVSSSRIRALVAAGEVSLAHELLGRTYRIRGIVGHGAGRGRMLGFPTANLEQIVNLLPGQGIYAGRAWPQGPRLRGGFHPAAVSIGPNPTFGEGALKVEAHLLDFDDDLYDWPLELDFLARLRNITRFHSADALIAQMHRDVAETRRIVM